MSVCEYREKDPQVLHSHALFGFIPAPMARCPTSRSFFARCGIPRTHPSSLQRSPQLRRGAPCLHQRTWAENDGRSPSTAFVPNSTVRSLDQTKRDEGLRSFSPGTHTPSLTLVAVSQTFCDSPTRTTTPSKGRRETAAVSPDRSKWVEQTISPDTIAGSSLPSPKFSSTANRCFPSNLS
jgi:hypothetical protein